jgi:hypothetical protein
VIEETPDPPTLSTAVMVAVTSTVYQFIRPFGVAGMSTADAVGALVSGMLVATFDHAEVPLSLVARTR